MMSLKGMLERMGQAKTHLEVLKMVREVDNTQSDTIFYSEFLEMMLGKSDKKKPEIYFL